MRKTLLSILAGVVVMGSAVALPSAGDRKAACNKETSVWVDKTQACVPVNPCKSDNPGIRKAYCMIFFKAPFSGLPGDSRKLDLVVNKYVEQVLNTTVSEVEKISDLYVSIKTTDGGYYVTNYFDTDEDASCRSDIIWARKAYGITFDEDLSLQTTDGIVLDIPYEDQNCEGVGALASEMTNQTIERTDVKGKCKLLLCEK